MIVNVCASSRNYRDVYYLPNSYLEDRIRQTANEPLRPAKPTRTEEAVTPAKAKKIHWIQKLKSKLIKKKNI